MPLISVTLLSKHVLQTFAWSLEMINVCRTVAAWRECLDLLLVVDRKCARQC